MFQEHAEFTSDVEGQQKGVDEFPVVQGVANCIR